MPRFGKGKPMAEQARNLLKGYLACESRHAAKKAAGVKGGRSTGKIHSINTFNKYAGLLKNAGEWLKTNHQVRHLDQVTPAQAQAYLQHRRESGIAEGLELSDNYLLSHFFDAAFGRLGWLHRRQARERVARLIGDYDVRAPHADAAIETLSGGNQQKLVLARELALGPKVLIAAHPTRGLDVRTIAFIQDQLMAQRADGVGILLVSSDLSEIWEMADRVMAHFGRIDPCIRQGCYHAFRRQLQLAAPRFLGKFCRPNADYRGLIGEPS